MSRLLPFFAGLTLVLLAFGVHQALVAPTEAAASSMQRIFYIHVPSAAACLLLFLCNFVASIVYLRSRSQIADAWAVAAAETGVAFATIFLLTGSLWAHHASGLWWNWELRLTTSLVLWLLYVSYLMLRRSAEGGSASVLTACLAIIAFLDVPMVLIANLRLRTSAAQPMIGGSLTTAMKFALMAGLIGILAFAALLCVLRYRTGRREQRAEMMLQQTAAAC